MRGWQAPVTSSSILSLKGVPVNKEQLGNRLLWSTIPIGILCLISLGISVVLLAEAEQNWYEYGYGAYSGEQAFWDVTFLLSLLSFWVALVGGAALKVIGRNDRFRAYSEAQMYGSIHGWQQIAENAWRCLKGDACSMSVNKGYGAESYSLSVQSAGRSESAEGFSRPLYALQFAEYLWENVLSNRPQLTTGVVRETRIRWDPTRALGSGRPEPTEPQADVGRSSTAWRPAQDRTTCQTCRRAVSVHAQFCMHCGSAVD